MTEFTATEKDKSLGPGLITAAWKEDKTKRNTQNEIDVLLIQGIITEKGMGALFE